MPAAGERGGIVTDMACDRYTLIEKLANGGTAEIWFARRNTASPTPRGVAIKKLFAHLAENPSWWRKFLAEARVHANLPYHPGIVQLWDLGDADGTLYLAMEFVVGENAAAVVDRAVALDTPLSEGLAARIVAGCAESIESAYSARGWSDEPLRTVHCDLRPPNILVTYDGQVKIADWGSAISSAEPEIPSTIAKLQSLESYGYASPELCLGRPIDHRSDVFALGVVLFELCTGKRPFDHSSPLMILRKIAKRECRRPSKFNEHLDSELEEIIMRALERKPEARFQTAKEMQLALEAYLDGIPAPSTNADLGVLMHTLFEDRIATTQAMVDLAESEDPVPEKESDVSGAFGGSPGSRRAIVERRRRAAEVEGVHGFFSWPLEFLFGERAVRRWAALAGSGSVGQGRADSVSGEGSDE